MNVNSQVKEEPSAALIRFLTDDPDRSDKESLGIGLFSCGQVIADLSVAQRLASLGESAIPGIERELDLIEHSPGWRYGSRWLLLTYARIRGPAAFQRLRRMEADITRVFDRPNVDDAIALSLGLTSYVSASRSGIRRVKCNRSPEPRDALDQFILAWQKNEPSMLEGSLGPGGREALTKLLEGNAWGAVRSELWRGESGRALAVGYKFRISGRWTEPDETLEQERDLGDAAVLLRQQAFRLETSFKDKFGRNCAAHSVSFIANPVAAKESPTYLVDNSDLRDLLGIIASCAAGAP